MSDPLITLTTDFGTASPYVAAMKGVILALNSRARLIDLTHDVPPQDIRHAAFFLASALPTFPPEALHVVVVDPGVGTDRAALYVEVAGRKLLAPDNGCWTLLADEQPPARVIRLAEPRFFRAQVSATFHGRDVFAPVAGHLSLGVDPGELGPPADRWVSLPFPRPRAAADRLCGEVVFIDGFGNLITNLPADALLGRRARVFVRSEEIPRVVRTYGEGGPGDLVALVSSWGRVEVAQVMGSAAAELQVGPGAAVTLEWQK
jgi:S-adenosylmethionine hydrolase